MLAPTRRIVTHIGGGGPAVVRWYWRVGLQAFAKGPVTVGLSNMKLKMLPQLQLEGLGPGWAGPVACRYRRYAPVNAYTTTSTAEFVRCTRSADADPSLLSL